MMRITEILAKHIKPIKPLTPAQARVHKLKAEVDKSRTALRTERDAQHRQHDLAKRRAQQSTAATLGKPRVHTAHRKSI